MLSLRTSKTETLTYVCVFVPVLQLTQVSFYSKGDKRKPVLKYSKNFPLL